MNNNWTDILQNNIDMMESTMDLVEDFVNFGTKQVSLVFGENSAFSRLIISGFGPLVENIDSIFGALESVITFKRNILDTFLSDNYDREKLLREILIKLILNPIFNNLSGLAICLVNSNDLLLVTLEKLYCNCNSIQQHDCS